MTNLSTPFPAPLAWAGQVLGALPSVRAVSHPRRNNSRVWQLTQPSGVRFFLKVSPRPVMYERETLALRQAGWIDFERAQFAAAVQHVVPMACGIWTDRPDPRAACIQAYGRDLTPEEQHALKCLAPLDAVSCLVWGPKLDDPHVTVRGRRTLDRLVEGVFA
ncbi:hypothetical protein ABT189_23600 [Streptomyces sp900105755]|uniref:hypothetical protein n=1 Tax=Streptomyces sp. 900105755 TaxID=3154389 RepID=UPI00332691DC